MVHNTCWEQKICVIKNSTKQSGNNNDGAWCVSSKYYSRKVINVKWYVVSRTGRHVLVKFW
jgi:hypothetical protein